MAFISVRVRASIFVAFFRKVRSSFWLTSERFASSTLKTSHQAFSYLNIQQTRYAAAKLEVLLTQRRSKPKFWLSLESRANILGTCALMPRRTAATTCLMRKFDIRTTIRWWRQTRLKVNSTLARRFAKTRISTSWHSASRRLDSAT